MRLTSADIETLMAFAARAKFTSLAVRSPDAILDFRKPGGAPAMDDASPPDMPAAAPQADAGAFEVKSVAAGRFQHICEPGADVQAGTILGNVRLARTFMDITSDRAGRLVEYRVADGASVEYGQPVAVLAPGSD